MILKIIIWPFKFIWVNLRMWTSILPGLLPHPNVKKDDRFLVLKDIDASGLTHWRAPATFGFDCTIPKGTVLVACMDAARISQGFSCIPENYDEFEKVFVPEKDRKDPKYNGYSFVMMYTDINKRLKKL